MNDDLVVVLQHQSTCEGDLCARFVQKSLLTRASRIDLVGSTSAGELRLGTKCARQDHQRHYEFLTEFYELHGTVRGRQKGTCVEKKGAAHCRRDPGGVREPKTGRARVFRTWWSWYGERVNFGGSARGRADRAREEVLASGGVNGGRRGALRHCTAPGRLPPPGNRGSCQLPASQDSHVVQGSVVLVRCSGLCSPWGG